PGQQPHHLARRFASARIGWVITRGEAGFSARPCAGGLVREVRDACALAAIPFFHKQFGGVGVTKTAKRGVLLPVARHSRTFRKPAHLSHAAIILSRINSPAAMVGNVTTPSPSRNRVTCIELP